MQFSLSEITCVVCCSEPSKPRIAVHTPKLTKGSSPLKLQFSGDTDMEDWMANLTSGKKLNINSINIKVGKNLYYNLNLFFCY